MKTFTKKMTIKDLRRAKSSYYGNPSFYIDAETEDGERLSGKTASNAAIGYELGAFAIGETRNFTCHFTPKGTLIFDFMR